MLTMRSNQRGRHSISLNPGQTAYIDSPQNNSLSLRCDGEAQVVAAVDATQLASQ
jgi:hypothetical protein